MIDGKEVVLPEKEPKSFYVRTPKFRPVYELVECPRCHQTVCGTKIYCRICGINLKDNTFN